MRALLDVNVLIAMHDASHVHHRRARDWFAEHVDDGWASCAVTQNGFVRVISQPRYPLDITTTQAISLLAGTCERSDHEFWSDDVRVTDRAHVDPTRVHGPKQVTDVYLLALATHCGGRLVTFDDGVPLSAVPAATVANLEVL